MYRMLTTYVSYLFIPVHVKIKASLKEDIAKIYTELSYIRITQCYEVLRGRNWIVLCASSFELPSSVYYTHHTT